MIYTSSRTSKTGVRVPAFSDGKPMFSLYAPEKDAAGFADIFDPGSKGFTLVGGVGNGDHLRALLKRCPEMKILAVEAGAEDLSFLRREFDLRDLEKDRRLVFSTIKTAGAAILSHYAPVLQGGFSLCFQSAWKNACPGEAAALEMEVREALKTVGGDMSTQGAFGKLWLRNICLNAGELLREPGTTLFPTPQGKTCIIAAAGPTIEDHLDEIRNSCSFVLAVDTAYPMLRKRGIAADGVVTVDAQAVSAEHFAGLETGETVLFADICACPAAVRSFRGRRVFFAGAHPLGRLFREKGPFPLRKVKTESGTVTLAALDLAVQLGFTEVRIFGADFSCPGGRPYARGTYLERGFYSGANRLESAEQKYTALLCRSPGLLDSYYEAARAQIGAYTEVKIRSESARNISTEDTAFLGGKEVPPVSGIPANTFDGAERTEKEEYRSADFFAWYLAALQNPSSFAEIIPSVLPLGAWYKKKGADFDIFSLCNLAHTLVLRYT